MTPAERTRALIESVCDEHGVKLDDVFGYARTERISRARHDAMFRVHQTGRTLREVGRAFGRDHKSVVYAIKRMGQPPRVKPVRGWF
jgi:chromosomal replication initiation ATPase DnaA